MTAKRWFTASVRATTWAVVCVLGMHFVHSEDGPDPFTVPDGKPPVIVAYVQRLVKLQPPKNATPEQKKEFLVKKFTAISQAADKVLAAEPNAKLRLAVVEGKLEALHSLDQNGEATAKKQLAEFADKYKDDKQSEVAHAVQPYLHADTKEPKKPETPPSWEEIQPKFAAAPEDKALATQALQAVQALERSGNSKAALQAHRDLQAIMAKSRDAGIAGAARQLDGVIRRLSLVGSHIEIRGHLVDGTPVNPSALKGKVVLVDFWATWCGPCKAELPNILANYEKYHDKGFEVVGVSLDQDKGALVKFIADAKLPWPIMFHDPGSGPSMADYYAVHAIPFAVLVNQQGEVVSTNARGGELGRLLEKLLGK